MLIQMYNNSDVKLKAIAERFSITTGRVSIIAKEQGCKMRYKIRRTRDAQ